MLEVGWGARRVAMALLGLCLCLSGCQTADEALTTAGIWTPPIEASTPPPIEPTVTMQNPDDVKYYPSDEPLRMGVEHFSRGNYAIAERYFQDAVEKTPRDVTAWIGLA